MEKGRARGELGSKREGKRSRGSREKGAAPARNFGPAAIAAGGRGRADAGKEKSSATSRKSSARRGGNAPRVAREEKNWGGEGVCEWLRGQEEGGKCARAVEEGALSLRALLSPPEVHLFLPLFSPQIPLSLSLHLSATLPPAVLRIRPVRPRSRTSIVYTAAPLSRLLFLRCLGCESTPLSPSLSFASSVLRPHRVTVTEPTLSASFLSSFRLLRPSRLGSVRSTLVDKEGEEEEVEKKR